MVGSEHICLKIKLSGNLPSKKNCYQIIKMGKFYSLAKTKRAKAFEKEILYQIPAVYKGKPDGLTKRGKPKLIPYIEKWFKMDTIIYYKGNQADFNKELILDVLQDCGVINNDRYYLGGMEEKRFDKENPRIELTIKGVEL